MDIEQENGVAGNAVPANPAGAMAPKGLSRRNFTRAGIGASGVLLTLASQPGMASSICRTPSGSLSGGLQSHAPVVSCAGQTPTYYTSNPGWSGGATPSTVFKSVFSVPGTTGFGADTTTFGFLLNGNKDVDPSSLGMYMVTTYLNIVSGRIGFLTVDQLQAIWNEWQGGGYYTPTAGVQWNASQIVTYLSGTAS